MFYLRANFEMAQYRGDLYMIMKPDILVKLDNNCTVKP